jgi:hypothetical protein
VDEWLGHGEIEMAFESLCLSLRAENVAVPERARDELLLLGPGLGLDKESVFEPEFWAKTVEFLAKGEQR